MIRKNLQSLVLPIRLLACAALIGMSGCAGLPKGTTVRSEVAYWAQLGGDAALIENPKNAVAIQGAVAYLDAAEANGGTFTVSTLREVVGRFKELQSKDAKLAILGGTAVIRRYFRTVELQTPELLREAALGLRDGLKAALGQSAPPVEPSTQRRSGAEARRASKKKNRAERLSAHAVAPRPVTAVSPLRARI